MNYQEYLQTEGWKRRKGWALIFWDYKCAICYSDKNLNVHHRTYARLGAEKITDMLPLCRDCHERHHGILIPALLNVQISDDVEIGG